VYTIGYRGLVQIPLFKRRLKTQGDLLDKSFGAVYGHVSNPKLIDVEMTVVSAAACSELSEYYKVKPGIKSTYKN
jgi:hypothetical protein